MENGENPISEEILKIFLGGITVKKANKISYRFTYLKKIIFFHKTVKNLEKTFN